MTKVLAESAALTEATPRILRAVCESIGWEVGIFWVADHHARVLRSMKAWHSASIESAVFEQASQQTALGPGVGLPGRVWEKGAPAWIQDVTKDTNFPRVAAAVKSGLHAAFAFPVTTARAPLGVFGVLQPPFTAARSRFAGYARCHWKPDWTIHGA
ncbi:MAG: GAF domain-containing protein [Terriglobia bacterium]